MRRLLLLGAVLALAGPGRAALAASGAPTPEVIRACIDAAANAYREAPALILILLNVEGGTLGAVSRNTNGTVDIGPMQVNQIWIPELATHWHASPQATFLALRDSFCANVEAGAWILRQGLDQSGGDFWRGVGYYHSHDPGYRRRYLRAVLAQALQLQVQARTERAGPAESTPRDPRPVAAPVRIATGRNAAGG